MVTWFLRCQHCGEKVYLVDSDEFVAWFADRHVPHLGAMEYIEVIEGDAPAPEPPN